MKPRAILALLALLCTLLIVFYALCHSTPEGEPSPSGHTLADSVVTLEQTVRELTLATPGLGEYMTGLQLHMAKLWFAVKYENWRLAKYELDELTETMQAAEALHVIKNTVNITEVLAGVRNAMIPPIDDAIAANDRAKFATAYAQLITGCNGCHSASDHAFIKIEQPRSEPVTNQRWAP